MKVGRRAPVQGLPATADNDIRSSKGHRMADIGEPLREIEVWPLEEPVPTVVPIEVPETTPA